MSVVQDTIASKQGHSHSRRRSSAAAAVSFLDTATPTNISKGGNVRTAPDIDDDDIDHDHHQDDDEQEQQMSQRELDILQLLAEDDQHRRRASVVSSSSLVGAGRGSINNNNNNRNRSHSQQSQQAAAIRRASIASFSSMASSSQKFHQQQAWLASLGNGDNASTMDAEMDMDFMNGGGGAGGNANGGTGNPNDSSSEFFGNAFGFADDPMMANMFASSSSASASASSSMDPMMQHGFQQQLQQHRGSVGSIGSGGGNGGGGGGGGGDGGGGWSSMPSSAANTGGGGMYPHYSQQQFDNASDNTANVSGFNNFDVNNSGNGSSMMMGMGMGMGQQPLSPPDSYSLSYPGAGFGFGGGLMMGGGPRSAGSRGGGHNGGGGSSSSPSDTLLSSPLVQELFVDAGGALPMNMNSDGSGFAAGLDAFAQQHQQQGQGWNNDNNGFDVGVGGAGGWPHQQQQQAKPPPRLGIDIDDDLFLLPPAGSGPLSAGFGQLSFDQQRQRHQQQQAMFATQQQQQQQQGGLFPPPPPPPPPQDASQRRASIAASQTSTAAVDATAQQQQQQRRSSGAATMDAIHRAAREMLRQSMAGQHHHQLHEPQGPLKPEEISPKDTSIKDEDDAFFAPAPVPPLEAPAPPTKAAKRTKPSKKREAKSTTTLEAPALQSEPSTTSAASANGENDPSTTASSGPMISKRGKILSHAESLHNKVEKRYRSNVKNALESLRDAVPRLREIYGTSLPEEKLGVDAPDAQGNIGGLPSLGKPTKKTIMEGSRLYIEHLENEVHALTHRVARAEEALARFMNAQQIAAWQQGEAILAAAVVNDVVSDRDRRARARAQMLGQVGSASDDDEDDVDEKRVVAKGKRKSDASGDNSDSSSGKRSRSSIVSKAGNAGVAALYSFGFAYSIYPFATDRVMRPVPQPAATSGRVIASSAAFNVHGGAGVPPPHASLNRLALLVVTAISLLVVWPLLSALLNRLTGVTSTAAKARREELKQVTTGGQRNAPIFNRILQVLRVGSLRGLLLEFGNVGKSRLGLSVWPASLREEEAWSRLLHAYAGGAIRCGALARLHIELRLWREGRTEPMQAILAALTTDDPLVGNEQWKHAQALARDYPDDVATTRLLQASWPTCRSVLASVGPTDRPISLIADQLVVRNLGNLFVQTFNDLVDDRIDSSTYRRAVSSALEGVPHGTEGSALGLVAIGLGNLLNGRQNTALANLLLAEQSKGVAGSMRSVDLVLRSLLPLPTSTFRSAPLSPLASATDILAAVCLRKALVRDQDVTTRSRAAIEMRALLADPVLDTLFTADEPAFAAADDNDDTESVSTLDSGAATVEPLSEFDSAAEDRRNRFYTQMDRFVDSLTSQCVLT